MKTVSEFRPTQFDHTIGAFSPMYEMRDWLVAPVTQTRDSGPLERSNFRVALQELRETATDPDNVRVCRYGHWGNGWYDIIICHPSMEETVERMETALEGYPVLDDMDLAELEQESYQECWDSYGRLDFTRSLADAMLQDRGAAYDWLHFDAESEALQSLYESLIPSGEYHDGGEITSRNISSAVGRCTRQRLAQFIRENR